MGDWYGNALCIAHSSWLIQKNWVNLSWNPHQPVFFLYVYIDIYTCHVYIYVYIIHTHTYIYTHTQAPAHLFWAIPFSTYFFWWISPLLKSLSLFRFSFFVAEHPRCRWIAPFMSIISPYFCWRNPWNISILLVHFWLFLWTNGYGSIPIHTIFRGMNIHKSQLFWCELQGYKVLTHCQITQDPLVSHHLRRLRHLRFLVGRMAVGKVPWHSKTSMLGRWQERDGDSPNQKWNFEQQASRIYATHSIFWTGSSPTNLEEIELCVERCLGSRTIVVKT